MTVRDGDILAAIDRAGIGFAIIDGAGIAREASASARHMLGFAPDADLSAMPWWDLDGETGPLRTVRHETYFKFRHQKEPWQGILRWAWPDGSHRYYGVRATAFADDHTIITLTDRTAEIAAQRDLEARETLTSSILDRLPIGIMLQDADGTVVYLNEELAARHDLDRSAVTGRPADDIGKLTRRGPADGFFREVLETGKPVDGRQVSLEDGPFAGSHWLVYVYPLPGRGTAPMRILTVEFDRTERVQLTEEKRLIQDKLHGLQKIEAINRFAGGLAHELSNILHPAGVYARALKSDPDTEDRDRLLGRINDAVLRAGDILRQTLAMAGPGDRESGPVAIEMLLREIVEHARDVAPKGLSYALRLPGAAITARANESELRQVMLNLLVNAADAQGAHGTVTVAAGLGAPPADLDRADRDEAFCWIDVTDEGPGVPAHLQKRIFEPFFTTKPGGRGTGLGLAVVQGIVSGWGGGITLEYPDRDGATFRVWIPLDAIAAENGGTHD